MKAYLLYLSLFLLLINCKQTSEQTSAKDVTAIPVEPQEGIGDGAGPPVQHQLHALHEAHHKTDFLKKQAISFKIKLDFGGKERIRARITTTPSGNKIKMEYDDGRILTYDGTNVYLSPKDATTTDARFDIFTWPYFFLFPYKLDDPGTQVEFIGENQLLPDQSLETFKLTFEDGTGDAPDDWYIGYTDPDGSIRAAAYIVTFRRDQETAEKSPHVILYEDYKNTAGIPIATTWKFYNWNKEKGATGEELGTASLSQIEFTTTKTGFFTAAQNSQVIPAPQ